ncbi:MAG: twin-arginine translocase subunit TatC [Deltaproteobacteria bacterium]|nr:twin-arginine translocase subunit TatC [Deltaproteobacteria bacterium]
MTGAPYPSGSDIRLHLLDVAEDLRRRLIRAGILLSILSASVFPVADKILTWFQERTAVPLAAFGIADIFIALVTVSLAAGAVAVLPYAAWQIFSAVAQEFPILTRRTRILFWSMAMLLFYSGVWFCIRLTLPYGSRFLLSYGSESLQPVICVRQFVSFCLIFTLGFGMLFELPLVMTLLAQLKVAKASLMVRYRRYAVILITIVAAVVTPTPDIVNLLLLAVPLYFLFEMGIIGMRISERRRRSPPVRDPAGPARPATAR